MVAGRRDFQTISQAFTFDDVLLKPRVVRRSAV